MPTLNWLTRDTGIRAATRVPYRLLEEASGMRRNDVYEFNGHHPLTTNLGEKKST